MYKRCGYTGFGHTIIDGYPPMAKCCAKLTISCQHATNGKSKRHCHRVAYLVLPSQNTLLPNCIDAAQFFVRRVIQDNVDRATNEELKATSFLQIDRRVLSVVLAQHRNGRSVGSPSCLQPPRDVYIPHHWSNQEQRPAEAITDRSDIDIWGTFVMANS